VPQDNGSLDFEVKRLSEKEFQITNVATGETSKLTVDNYFVDYGALIKFNLNGVYKVLQFISTSNNLNFHF